VITKELRGMLRGQEEWLRQEQIYCRRAMMVTPSQRSASTKNGKSPARTRERGSHKVLMRRLGIRAPMTRPWPSPGRFTQTNSSHPAEPAVVEQQALPGLGLDTSMTA
jgi:hypothetical protein